MVGADVEFVEVLEQERPLRGVQLWRRLFRRLDSEALLMLRCGCKQKNNQTKGVDLPVCLQSLSLSWTSSSSPLGWCPLPLSSYDKVQFSLSEKENVQW